MFQGRFFYLMKMNKSFYNSGGGLFPDRYHKHRNSNKQILIYNNYLSKICIY